MTLIGILMAVAGVLGVVGVFTGIIAVTGPLSDIRIWAGVAVAGILLAVFTRRPRD